MKFINGLLSEQIAIVGWRHGAYADDLVHLFNPMENCSFTDFINDDEVLLSKIGCHFDDNTVAVFSDEDKLLGYVWAGQSDALLSWMNERSCEYVRAHIVKTDKIAEVFWAVPEIPIVLNLHKCYNTQVDMAWADGMPVLQENIEEEKLARTVRLLRDDLKDGKKWNARMQNRFDRMRQYLPTDLSANSFYNCVDVINMLANSEIDEVRDKASELVHYLVKRGSSDKIEWWMNEWWPKFVKETAKNDQLPIYKASGYSQERIEEILRKAPNNLFSHYQTNMFCFCKRLLYSKLPQIVYSRLLTLLAVRDLMLKDGKTVKKEKTQKPPVVANDFRLCVTNPEQADVVIEKLHQLMEGKTKPKDVVMPIRAAMNAGALGRPTWESFCQEFGADRIKSKSSYSAYTNIDIEPYQGSDFNQMVSDFKKLIS